jgi:hypothetical protein
MALKKGKAVTGQWLAQQLQGYGIRPKTMGIGKERARGYEWEDLKEAFRRYIPRSEVDRFKQELREEAKPEEKPPSPAKEGQDGATGGNGDKPGG